MIKVTQLKEYPLYTYQDIKQELLALADPAYRAFHSGLMRTKYEFYGVRTPALKALARRIYKTGAQTFLEYAEEHGFESYEQVMLFAFLLGKMKDEEVFEEHLPYFLDAVDNWALCDQGAAAMHLLSKNKEGYLGLIESCLTDDRPYVRRFAFSALISHFRTEEYAGFALAAALENQESLQCVSSAKAWLFQAFYLVAPKEVRAALFSGVANGRIIGLPDEKTKRQAMQKLRDSHRVSNQDKNTYFRG